MLLHITNDYSGSKVYKNLIRELDLLEVEQIVYTPVKSEKSINKNKFNFRTANSSIIYSNILNETYDKLFYGLKVKKILKDVESKVNLTKITFIHAHTWYSDGGVAYLLHKKYGIPYIVSVRNSDINVFYKYLLHKRPFGKKILETANQIVFISGTHHRRFLGFQGFKKFSDKYKVIPNGVDSFWLDNALPDNPTLRLSEKPKLLYVGKFSSEKNVPNLIRAVVKLSKRMDVEFHIVGVGGSQEKKALSLIDKHPKLIRYHGQINDLRTLLATYKKCDLFVMPSNRETFGLVYVEAMLLGLPILYTENEGIDGFYEENIGEKVKKGANSSEILEKLQLLTVNYKNYHLPTKKLKENHDWKNIAKEYLAIYY